VVTACLRARRPRFDLDASVAVQIVGPRRGMMGVLQVSHPRDMLRGWKLGCDGYLRIPFLRADLAAMVHEVISRDADERERARRAGIGRTERLLAAAD
jgi:hypothetical protein